MSTIRKSVLLKKSPNTLRKLCKLRNLSCDGTKADLINRLRGETPNTIINNKINTRQVKSTKQSTNKTQPKNKRITSTKKTRNSTKVKCSKINKNKNKYNLFKDISECQQPDVSKCQSLQRIKILLQQSVSIPENIKANEYTDIQLLNDFCHIKYYHKINKHTDTFQKIHTNLTKHHFINHTNESDNMFDSLISTIYHYFRNIDPTYCNKQHNSGALIVHGFIRRNTTSYFANILQQLVMIYYIFIESDTRIDETSLFLQNLYLCRIPCDFTDKSDKTIELREHKSKLLQWLDTIYEKWRDHGKHILSLESFYPRILSTISYNLFGTFPPTGSIIEYTDTQWKYLKVIYDLLWRVSNTIQFDSTIMHNQWRNDKFLCHLVELFSSKDDRERQYLMLLLHKIYGRCIPLRPYITHIIFEYLYRRIYNNEFQHNLGIVELLQIICAIIPGLTIPVKSNWKQFLENILIPLHKCKELQDIWEHVTQCLVNYAAKDGDGAATLLVGIMKLWPKKTEDPIREMIFIIEIVNIMTVLQNHHIDGEGGGNYYKKYKNVLISFWNKLTDCMLSTDENVAERAIQAFNEPVMQRLVKLDTKTFLPKLIEVFYKNRNNPNEELRQLSIGTWRNYQSIRGVDVYMYTGNVVL
eukprot:79400_1